MDGDEADLLSGEQQQEQQYAKWSVVERLRLLSQLDGAGYKLAFADADDDLRGGMLGIIGCLGSTSSIS